MMTFARGGRANGFSLIEVLVTLFVAAVGLLGVAAIVLFSMRASFESSQQSVAALLAIDTHERAWLSAHEPSTKVCGKVIIDGKETGWIDRTKFAPGRTIEGLTTTVTGTFPNCVFTVQWDGSNVGVVGGMAGFGGIYTHNFTIPSPVVVVP
jgi:prepilin-type N-terminal cleavage/methylation domain-containing protein